jgi:hypothetical protein
MAGIVKKSFEHPEDTLEFVHGRSLLVSVGDEGIWRSELEPGWNWDEDLEPYADGAASCPLTHREYVVAGRIRYLMEDGTEEVGSPGDYLFIQPGHRAWVVGEGTCVLIDW